MPRLGVLALLVTAGVTAACSYPPLELQTIQVGRSLNTDQSVSALATTFKPNETVYVSVLTTGRGESTIGVKWYVGQQLLSEREKPVRFRGAGATEFSISSAAGFPVNDYSVEVFIDGRSVGRRAFNVAR